LIRAVLASCFVDTGEDTVTGDIVAMTGGVASAIKQFTACRDHRPDG
jgi:hypothetical protein